MFSPFGLLVYPRLTVVVGRKYQFMEMNTQRRAAGLKDKIPDIQKTLDTVTFLGSRNVCLAGLGVVCTRGCADGKCRSRTRVRRLMRRSS